MSAKLAIILAMIIAVAIYVISIMVLNIFTKEEVKMMPYGNKILKVLEKLKIY